MRRLALAAILVAASFPALAQAPGQTIDVGGWKVTNSKNAAGLQTCATFYTFDDKSIVGFSADAEGATTFLFSEPEAKLKENGQYPVDYHVDKNKAFTATGIAVSSSMVVVPVPDNLANTLFKQFVDGNSLFVTVAGNSFEEPLSGSGDAIKALASCVQAAKNNK